MSHRVTAIGEATSLAERKRRAGQRLIIGLSGSHVTDDERILIKEIQPAGFILFARNVEEPRQVIELNRELTSLLPVELPPICTVDQEGGRVQRVKGGATIFPPLRWVGNCDDDAILREHARALATEVKALGFHLNWAPVADVDSNPANPIIGDRSFGSDAKTVAQSVHNWIIETQNSGVMAAAKHFPGHGDTSQDSHLTLPTVDKDTRDISEVELRPFRAAVRANVAAVMTAHVMFPAFDEKWPATLSTRILIEILRKEMNYNGLVVTDDLEMKAVADRFDLETQLQQACLATVDLFLACKSPVLQMKCYEGLIHLQEEEPIRQVRLAELSEKRLKVTRERFMKNSVATPDFSLLDCNNHRDLVTMIRARGGE